MTIKQYIISKVTEQARERVNDLVRIGAPDVVIEAQNRNLSELEKGNIKIGGDVEVLTEEFINISDGKKGRGGKVYYTINGNINFFPNAKYGLLIRRAK